MKKKLLTILLSMFLVVGSFMNAVYAQSYNITISCDSDQGYFTDANYVTLDNPSVLSIEKDVLYLYREGTKGTSQYNKLWIYDGKPFGNLVYFFIATPEEGYDFDGWYIGDTEISNGYSEVETTVSITAKFVSYTKKVTGTVLDEDDNPVEGAEVKFECPSLYKYYTTTTDAEGKWSIDAKMNGTYSLKIKKSGFSLFEENGIDFENTDKDLGSKKLVKLQLTYSTNGNGNTLSYDMKDDVITLTANPASGYQLSNYEITLQPEAPDYYNNVQYNGKSLKFSMPSNSNIDVVGNFVQYIDTVSVSVDLPKVGDTTYSNPTVVNNKLCVDDVYVYDMDEAINNDNYDWSAPTEFVEGGHYMIDFCVRIKDDYIDDYAFKYNKDDEFDSYYYYSHDYYGYDVDFTLNETTVPMFENDEDSNNVYEVIGESGFYGYDTSLCISYQFTVSGEKPIFINEEFNIEDNYSGTLEFVVDKSYNTDDGGDVTVKVDNVEVNPSNYDLAKASTHVTLHNNYLKTLLIGEHYLTICIEGYDDITQKFTISSSTPTPTQRHVVLDTSVE